VGTIVIGSSDDRNEIRDWILWGFRDGSDELDDVEAGAMVVLLCSRYVIPVVMLVTFE